MNGILDHANLTSTRLTNINLSNADLTGAQLDKTELDRSNLCNVTLSDGSKSTAPCKEKIPVTDLTSGNVCRIPSHDLADLSLEVPHPILPPQSLQRIQVLYGNKD